jgi:hypothetical protein
MVIGTAPAVGNVPTIAPTLAPVFTFDHECTAPAGTFLPWSVAFAGFSSGCLCAPSTSRWRCR